MIIFRFTRDSVVRTVLLLFKLMKNTSNDVVVTNKENIK